MDQDSSIKYHKFAVSQQEDGGSNKLEKNSESNKLKVMWSPQTLGVLLTVLVIIIVVIAVTIGVGVGISATKQTSGLKIISLSQNNLQGAYYGSNGGILFQSTINSSYGYLTISSTNGASIVIIVHQMDTPMTMMGVNDTNFLFMRNPLGSPDRYTDYVIPNNYTNVMESVMSGHVNMSDEVLQELDSETVDATRQSSLKNLAMSQEALLIIEAAKALGSRGILGLDYPAVMKFYLLALRLSTARTSIESESETVVTVRSSPMDNHREKRATRCNANQGGDKCDECPYSSGSNNCFGMCGRLCDCWRFICGDCCVHQYCRTHDECCARRGFFSRQCFAVVFDYWWSSCSDNYDC